MLPGQTKNLCLFGKAGGVKIEKGGKLETWESLVFLSIILANMQETADKCSTQKRTKWSKPEMFNGSKNLTSGTIQIFSNLTKLKARNYH